MNAVACTVLDGTPVAVTGGSDGAVRLWDLTGGIQRAVLTGHDDWVNAVACTVLDGTPIAVTGGDDRTMRIWNLTEARLLEAHALPVPARCVAVTQQGGIVVGASRELIGLAFRARGR